MRKEIVKQVPFRLPVSLWRRVTALVASGRVEHSITRFLRVAVEQRVARFEREEKR